MPAEITVQGWNVGGQLEKFKPDGRGGGDWITRIPFGVLPLKRYEDEDGETRGFLVRFTRPDSTRDVIVPARALRAARPADAIAEAGGPDLQLQWSKAVVELLSDVMAGLGNVPIETVITRAAWTAGELRIPGASGLAPMWDPALRVYGDRADLPEEAARQAWREIVEGMKAYPKATLVLGMPLGSVYTVPLELNSFALHLTGESHSGKTESAELAMSTMGECRPPGGALYRTWNMSEQAPTNLLRHVGVLPVWFDEAATSDRADDDFTRMLFNLAQGRSRSVADTEGGLREGSDERWTASILSTGEARLSTRSGLTGLRRRVLEVYAPLVASPDHHGTMMQRARAAYGWPIYWLAQDPDLEHARDLHRQIFLSLADLAEDQQVELAQATNVATCVMGFAQLARITGAHVPLAELKLRAASMFSKLVAAAAEEGADVGERGLRAVKEAIQSTDKFTGPSDDMFRDRWGVLFDDGYVGITGVSTLARILREFAGLQDPQPVLEKWSEHGLLQHDRGAYTGRRTIWVRGHGMKLSRLYLVKVR